MLRVTPLTFAFLALTPLIALAQQNARGILIYHEPAASYTEALEYRSFQQDNALYSTLVTPGGQRKQLRSSGVVAAVPYPSLSFDASFASAAETQVRKIDSLKQAYAQVKPQLEAARGRWSRALAVFNQTQRKVETLLAAHDATHLPALELRDGRYHYVRLIKATTDSATIAHAAGVASIPLADFSRDQVVLLNTTSKTVQLPTGLSRSRRVWGVETGTTGRIEAVGSDVVNFAAGKLGVTETTFSVWTFFVVFPAVVFVLLATSILFARRSRRPITTFPRPRPIS